MTHDEVTTEINGPARENGELDSTAQGNSDAAAPAEQETAPELIGTEGFGSEPPADEGERARLKAVIEAMIYITDEPLSLQHIAVATGRPSEMIREILEALVEEYARPDRGLTIRELAGGYKMSTKPEHHEEIRQFVKNLKPPLKLSLAALETLAVIAYKQPITAPEIMEIRGVQGAGVLKTLLDRKLIATAGRKNVVGKPILYKTTREFLIQFGLKDLSELPTLKEFEELGRLALSDEPAPEPPVPAETHTEQLPPQDTEEPPPQDQGQDHDREEPSEPQESPDADSSE